jgi:hypothetical protein
MCPKDPKYRISIDGDTRIDHQHIGDQVKKIITIPIKVLSKKFLM